MSLQAQLLADFGDTLADPDGPAQDAVIGGRACRVVLDTPEQTSMTPDGFMQARMDIYLLAGDLGYQPHTGQTMSLGGVEWVIENPIPHGPGVYRLQITRYMVR